MKVNWCRRILILAQVHTWYLSTDCDCDRDTDANADADINTNTDNYSYRTNWHGGHTPPVRKCWHSSRQI